MNRRALRWLSFHKFFRRRIWRRRGFGFHFLAGFVRFVLIRDRGPAEIDRRDSDRLFHSWRPFVRDRLSNHRRGDDNRFTAHFRSRRFAGKIDIHISFESIPLDRLATDRAQFIVIRAFIHDGRVAVSNVGDVRGLIDDRHVAFRRKQRLLNPRRAEFAARDETILIRPDVIIVVGPVVNAGALVELRFRRQRRPADIIIALAP